MSCAARQALLNLRIQLGIAQVVEQVGGGGQRQVLEMFSALQRQAGNVSCLAGPGNCSSSPWGEDIRRAHICLQLVHRMLQISWDGQV